MGKESKELWKMEARRAKEMHTRMFPNYKYSPRKPGQKKKRQSRKKQAATRTAASTATSSTPMASSSTASPAPEQLVYNPTTTASSSTASHAFNFNSFPNTTSTSGSLTLDTNVPAVGNAYHPAPLAVPQMIYPPGQLPLPHLSNTVGQLNVPQLVANGHFQGPELNIGTPELAAATDTIYYAESSRQDQLDAEFGAMWDAVINDQDEFGFRDNGNGGAALLGYFETL
jgi:hypothetical protein